MIDSLTKEQIIQVITTIVNKHGCAIEELDVENHVLDIGGPEDARIECAKELEMFLD